MKPFLFRAGKGFSALELLMVVAVIAVIAGLGMPMYHVYKIRSDLNLAVEQAEQALRRAQLLSQTGYEDDVWAYRPDAGILFKGESFSARNTESDIAYPVPQSVTVSGLPEVVYSRIYGVPGAVGDIIFTAKNGEQRILTVRAEHTLAGPPVPPVRLRVHFDRIKNNGNGAVTKQVFVGSEAVLYAEDVWIPLTENGVVIVDDGMDLEVAGISMQRQNGFVRIVAYGGLDNGGKEVVDATIEVDRAFIDHVENEAGENEGEQPFDGNENEGVGGDEYILASDGRSVQFKSRVTNAGDTILLFWQ